MQFLRYRGIIRLFWLGKDVGGMKKYEIKNEIGLLNRVDEIMIRTSTEELRKKKKLHIIMVIHLIPTCPKYNRPKVTSKLIKKFANSWIL